MELEQEKHEHLKGYTGWIETYEGRQFFPLAPVPGTCSIEDIAHALGNKCRYTGHSPRFYSVAEHSVKVAEILAFAYPGEISLQLAGLLHDAAEAYLPDLPSPIKKHFFVQCPDGALRPFREVEDEVLRCVALMAELPLGLFEDPRVKAADMASLWLERGCFQNFKREWNLPKPDFANLGEGPAFWDPRHAEVTFLRAYHGLVKNLPAPAPA